MDIISKTHSPSLANLQREEWQDDALCAEIGDELFFPPKGGSYKEGKAVCGKCDVRDQCLAYIMKLETGIDNRFGLYGGLSPNERRRLVRKKTPAKRKES